MAWNDRTKMVLDEQTYDRICGKHIVLVGVGGVGGAVLECLVRFGIRRITVIDFDTVDETNLNRQIVSTTVTVGMLKVDAAVQRARSIVPDIDIRGIDLFLSEENMETIGSLEPDYVIDAIDSVKSKLSLIEYCRSRSIPIVSSMGTGNRFSPAGFGIDKVENSAGNGCGLSRVMRRELRKRGIEGHMSLYNLNPPLVTAARDSHGRHPPGSTVFAPNAAGILIAQYVCEQLAKE